MTPLTAIGTPPPAHRCDPHRLTGAGRGDVTPAIRTSPGLLAGRYLHTNSGDVGRVSIALAGSWSRPLPNSQARPPVKWMPAGPQHGGRRSGWLAVDLMVHESNLNAVDHVATQPDENMTELPATNRAERSAISMAPCAPSDIGVAEVHDFCTGIDPIGYEEGCFAEAAAASVMTTPEGPVTDGG